MGSATVHDLVQLIKMVKLISCYHLLDGVKMLVKRIFCLVFSGAKSV